MNSDTFHFQKFQTIIITPMKSSLISEYNRDLYKNWANSRFIESTYGSSLSYISSKIKKTAADGPFIDGDIAEFILQVIGNYNTTDEELNEHVRLATFYIRKGNDQEILRIVKSNIKKS